MRLYYDDDGESVGRTIVFSPNFAVGYAWAKKSGDLWYDDEGRKQIGFIKPPRDIKRRGWGFCIGRLMLFYAGKEEA